MEVEEIQMESRQDDRELAEEEVALLRGISDNGRLHGEELKAEWNPFLRKMVIVGSLGGRLS
jgi:hypothetical protein